MGVKGLATYVAGVIFFALFFCHQRALSDTGADVRYVYDLDGVLDITNASVCRYPSSTHVCAGCSQDGSTAVGRSGKPFYRFDEGYIIDLMDKVGLHTVVSRPRLRATAYLLKNAIMTVPGDVVETGVFKGGSGILMALALKDWDTCGRKYWGFDSFRGLPKPVTEDTLGGLVVGKEGDYAAGLELVQSTFNGFGLNDSIVRLVPGWYNESLPVAEVQHIAFLRLDGDMFVSTWDALVNLYHKVMPGGLVYVDDYAGFNGCREAVDRFRLLHGIAAPLHWIREGDKRVEAVWWQKIPGGHHAHFGSWP